MASKEQEAYDSDASSTKSESDDDYDKEEVKDPEEPKIPMKKGRRQTVMAAAVSVSADWTPPFYEKSESESFNLKASVESNILFSELDASELNIVIGAMKKITYQVDDEIIKQGQEGDLFYVIESGSCDIFVEGVGKVMDIGGFESGERNFFGELALLYDAPRAATVVASSEVVAWGLDRVTFKMILQDTTQKQRNLHRSFLESVPVLAPLSTYERLTIADALILKNFEVSEAGKASEAKRAKRAKRATTSLRRRFFARYLLAISCGRHCAR